MVLNDKTIARLAVEKEMISPFIPTSVSRILGTCKTDIGAVPIDYKALSFGTSSYHEEGVAKLVFSTTDL